MSGVVRVEERNGQHVAIVELDAEECENIAHALGFDDGGAHELLNAAAEIRRRDDG